MLVFLNFDFFKHFELPQKPNAHLQPFPEVDSLFVCFLNCDFLEQFELSQKSNAHLQPLPEVDEGETQEETQASSKLSHQGFPGVEVFLESMFNQIIWCQLEGA